MDSPKLIRLALLSALAAAALAGCGDDGGDGSTAPALDELARYAPTEAAAITFVDFAAAREELELPDGADALDFDALQSVNVEDPTPEAQLVEAAVLAMPSLTSFVVTFEEDPNADVFDGAAITGALNTIGEGFPMTVIHTEQPFSEIADGLVELGWTQEGSTVTKEGERFEQVADAGDGIVVVGNNGAAADAVAAEAEGPTALVDLLEPADQPIAAAANGIPDDCITTLGGWENAELTEGTLRFAFDSEASAENFDLDELNESLRITAEEPAVDGETAEIAFTSEQDGPAVSRTRVMLTRFVSGYDCG